MSDKRTNAPDSGISLGDIYFVLFRRKWLIFGFSVAGILAALTVCFVHSPQYKSEAEISLSVLETKPTGGPGEETGPMNEPSANLINTEITILKSLDLAQDVVRVLTPAKILAAVGGGTDTNEAAYLVKNGLTVEPAPGSSVINLTFQHPDQEIVQRALNEIIDGYFIKHSKMRGEGGVFGAFLTNETTRFRGEMIQIEKKIQQAQSEAGVISTEDARDAYSAQITKLRSRISGAEEELAERQAALKALTAAGAGIPDEAAAKTLADQYDTYRRICARLVFLRNKEDDYLTQQGFTEENVLVKAVRSQIADSVTIKNQLEKKCPQWVGMELPALNPARGTTDVAVDLPDQITALKAKIGILRSQLKQVWTDSTNLERVETTISELQQKKKSGEASLKYFTDHLERSRIDNALNEGKVSNISIVQSPTPPLKGWSKKTLKTAGLLAAGGLLAGLAVAFLLELILDRSVKRPAEIEIKLGLPLFISIPDVEKNGYGKYARRIGVGRRRLNHAPGPATDDGTPGTGVAPWDREHPLRRFYEGLRDRLIVHFEVRNLVHKPKLVAVTSCGHDAGVSSIAAGLAATLSETGDGHVLLVNISGDRGAAQQFYKGEPGFSLDEVLDTEKKGALMKASLYSITEQANGDVLPANLPRKLATLMPKLKASEYDYIIFDMPPVCQTSATARLSGLMDMVLLVIESEKTNQDVVKRVIQLLAESKASVGTVLNKSRNYIPALLHQEFLN